jgi:hypothetical protein
MTEAEQSQKRVAQAALDDPAWPRPGERWRHYKGGEYVIVTLAVIEATAEPAVVYRSEMYGYVWVRPVSVFMEWVPVDGQLRPRFERIARDV